MNKILTPLIFTAIFSLITHIALADVDTGGGSTSSGVPTMGASFWGSALHVEEGRTLEGVEQHFRNVATGVDYWAVVIDAGTAKPTTRSVGTVLVAENLGTTAGGTGWVGTTNGLDVDLYEGHWYIVGVAIRSSATKFWYYRYSASGEIRNDFGWGEYVSGSYFDMTNPPDSSFSGADSTFASLIHTRFYTEPLVAPELSSVSLSQSLVKLGDMLTVSSAASDEDDAEIRLECGSTSESSDLCIGDYEGTDPSCSFTVEWNDDSSHAIYCRAYDGRLYSTESTASVTTDNTIPTVNIDSPTGWFKNDFNVQYDATDANVDMCRIFTKNNVDDWIERSDVCGNDRELGVTVGSGGYCAEGRDTCNVKVYAKDLVDNENEIVRTFSIDLTPPDVVSLSHYTSAVQSPPVVTPDDDVTIRVEASDSLSGLKEVTIFVDNLTVRTCNSPPISPCLYTSRYPAGTYNYHTEIADAVENAARLPETGANSFDVVVPEIIVIKAGWDIVSIPYTTFTFISSTCESGRNFYNYDSSARTWNIIKDVKDVQGGKGYWVYSEKICEIKIMGQDRVQGGDIVLINGWNHIGSPFNESSFQSVRGGCTINKILSYDNSVNNWKILSNTDRFEKHKGYFVKATC